MLDDLQHWRALAEAAYCNNLVDFSLFANVPASAVLAAEWEADLSTLRPSYQLVVDATYLNTECIVCGLKQRVSSFSKKSSRTNKN